MNIKNLTNAEILYHEDLKDKILIKIPGTHFHLLCTYIKKSDSWNAHLLELITTKRRQIAREITNKSLSILIVNVLKNGKDISFKNTKNIKELAREIRTKLNKLTTQK